MELENKRNKVVVTKVTNQEYQSIVLAAKRCDMNVSSYIRACSLGYKPKCRLSVEEQNGLKILAKCRIDLVNFANALAGLTNEEKLSLFHNHRVMLQWYERVVPVTNAVIDYLQSVQKSNNFPPRSIK